MAIFSAFPGIYRKVKIGQKCQIFPIFRYFDLKTWKKRLFDQFLPLPLQLPQQLFSPTLQAIIATKCHLRAGGFFWFFGLPRLGSYPLQGPSKRNFLIQNPCNFSNFHFLHHFRVRKFHLQRVKNCRKTTPVFCPTPSLDHILRENPSPKIFTPLSHKFEWGQKNLL